eukprot:403344386
MMLMQNQMKIEDFYKGKILLVTGCTGFLGKVVLEKILRSLDCEKIYLLIRPKKGISVMERAKKEIFQSAIFDGLRKEHNDFMAFIDKKIVAVEGDISEAKLILNDEKLEDIKREVNVIINNAASIDFNLRLDQAIQINYMGPQRLLALAKQCKNCDVFTHVSTCYVNSEKQGFIDEKVYQYQDDPDEIVQSLLRLSEQEILSRQVELVKPWANTYTFTKNLSERALQKHRGDFPVLILRPAIIICAYEQPVPGWIDSLAAAGALTLFASLGALHYVPTTYENRGDIIPVDFVSNGIIVGTAFQARQNNLTIQHSASSHAHPILWSKYMNNIMDYAKKIPMENRVGSIRIRPVSLIAYKKLFYIESVLPAKMMQFVSQYAGSQTFKKNVQKLNKLNDKLDQIVDLLKDFTIGDWCFESKRAFELFDMMHPEDRVTWNFNPKTIEWTSCSYLMVYGIQKYMMKMDVPLPYDQSNLINKLNIKFFEDSALFMAKCNKIKNVNLDKLIEKVIFSDRIQSQIKIQSQESSNQHNINSYRQLMKEIFHQVFKKIFDQIIVSDPDLKQITQIQQTRGKSVVLIPSFKSYLDFILLIYVHIIYEIELPFIIGMAEFQNVAVLSKILRRCGGFFVNYQKMNQTLPRVLLEEFLKETIKNQNILGYHLERKRERSGKIIKPLPFIFEQIVDTCLKNSTEIEDIILQPITINYDKIYEGQQFPFELLGDESKRESSLKILRNIFWVNEQYGKVHVKYCKPISLREKAAEFVKANNLALTLTDNLVIMSTQMVASIIISKRQGGITEDELVQKVGWLYDEIFIRGGQMSLNTKPTKATIKTALNLLKSFIETKKDVFSPQVKANRDYKNILMLAYYRNGIVHMFLNEAYIAASLLAFGQSTAESQGVLLTRLWDQTEFLINNLKDEFMVRNQISSRETFENTLRFMEKRGFVEITNDAQPVVKILKTGKFALKFLRSLISPFIESYWVTLSFLKQMRVGQQYLQADVERRIQWLAETLHDEGFLLYYEACSLESIGNSAQRYANLGVLKRLGEPYSLQNQQPEIYYYMSDDKNDFNTVKELYERLTFFKPSLTLITGMINFEDDVKRILAKAPQTSHPRSVGGKL